MQDTSQRNFDVNVLNFENPGKFAILRKYANEYNLKKLTDKMNNFYMQKRHQIQLEKENVSVNNAAVVSGDDQGRFWMRCKITKVLDHNRVEVWCVDHGKSMVVESSSLKKLKVLFSEQVPFAMECQLADIEVNGNFDGIKELFDTFYKSCYEVSVRIMESTNSKHVYSVHLFFMNDNIQVNFNAIIVGLRLAETSSPSLMNNFVSISYKRIVEIKSIDFFHPGDISLLTKYQNEGELREMDESSKFDF